MPGGGTGKPRGEGSGLAGRRDEWDAPGRDTEHSEGGKELMEDTEDADDGVNEESREYETEDGEIMEFGL